MWIFRFVLTHSAQNDNTLVILNFAEQSEVSTNLKCEFAFLGRGFFAFLQKAQNDKIRRHFQMAKCVFFVRHCEPFLQKRRGNPYFTNAQNDNVDFSLCANALRSK